MTTYPTPDPLHLTVQTGSGRVRIRAEDVTTSSVELTALNDAGEEAVEQTRVHHDDGRLLVDVPRRNGLLRHNPSVSVEVVVPTGSTITVKADSSDIDAEGTYADATCTTGSGDVAVESVEGDLHAKSGSGDVTVGRVDGLLDASTGSGDVALEQSGSRTRLSTGSGDFSIGRVLGDVLTKSGSGDLEVGVLAGALQAKTGSGDVVVRRATSGSLLAEGGSGDVEVGIEQGTAAWLDVSSQNGRVEQELGETDGPGESRQQVEIVAHTHSGDIRIHRS